MSIMSTSFKYYQSASIVKTVSRISIGSSIGPYLKTCLFQEEFTIGYAVLTFAQLLLNCMPEHGSEPDFKIAHSYALLCYALLCTEKTTSIKDLPQP